MHRPQAMKGKPKSKNRTSTILNKGDGHGTVSQAILYSFFSSIFLAAIWALIRWGWIEWGLLTHAKDYVPGCVIPIFLAVVHLFICRHFIKGLKDNIEGKYWTASWILSFLLFMCVGTIIERQTADIYELPAITADMQKTLEEADYIHVSSLGTKDLDMERGDYYLSYSTRAKAKRHGQDIIFHLYEVYALRDFPRYVFIGNEVTERHDYTHATIAELEIKKKQFLERELGHLSRMNMNDKYLKRLLPSDNIEGYQKAVSFIYKKEGIVFNSDEIIIYEITSRNLAKYDTFFWAICFGILLLIEGLMLIIAYSYFFVKKEYDDAINSSRSISIGSMLHQYDKVLLYSFPVLMAIILILMFFNGYSWDTTNYEMFLKWGALNKKLVVEAGEWWRLITYAFLHDGLLHLFGNLMLYIISSILLLRRYNGYQLIFLFIASVLVSGIFILFFSTISNCVGASGGVLGLTAFWTMDQLYAKYVEKDTTISFQVLYSPVALIVLNLVLSLSNGISMSGHLGGLVAGLILGAIIIITTHQRRPCAMPPRGQTGTSKKRSRKKKKS